MEAQSDSQAACDKVSGPEEGEIAPGERERSGKTEKVHSDNESNVNFIGEVFGALDFGRFLLREDTFRECNFLGAFIELLRGAVRLWDHLHVPIASTGAAQWSPARQSAALDA